MAAVSAGPLEDKAVTSFSALRPKRMTQLIMAMAWDNTTRLERDDFAIKSARRSSTNR